MIGTWPGQRDLRGAVGRELHAQLDGYGAKGQASVDGAAADRRRLGRIIRRVRVTLEFDRTTDQFRIVDREQRVTLVKGVDQVTDGDTVREISDRQVLSRGGIANHDGLRDGLR